METSPAQNMQSLTLKTQGAGMESPDARLHRLQKACQDFEALFLTHLIRTMRASSETEDSLFGEGFGGSLFQDLFDAEVAQSMSSQRSMGLAQQLMEQLKASGVLSEIESQSGGKAMGRIEDFDIEINAAADQYDLDPALIKAVIERESGGNPHTVSSKGAKGLMQLMDGTARELGVSNSFDPGQNIQGGARYLRQMLDRFDGDLELALAAYNAGPGTVERYGGVPPYEETQQYVSRVKASFDAYKPPTQAPSAATPELV